jgi:hypothetical protein
MLPDLAFLMFSVALFTASACAQRNPNHLEPIPPFDSDGYDEAVFHALIGGGSPQLWMICQPSFLPEYAVILRSEPFNLKADHLASPDEPQKWILEIATASKPIWHWKEYPPGHTGAVELDLQRDVPVERKRLEIPEPAAKAFTRAWDAVLRLTRYPDADYRGADGVTYQFYSHYNHFGEIWTPQTGLPADLTALAHRLIKLVDSSPKELDAVLTAGVTAAKQLEAAAKKTRAKPKSK